MLKRNVSGNFLVGNYGGGNGCVDNDDGSLEFDINEGCHVYGHQKFKVGGIRTHDNVLAYVTDLAGHWDGPGELGYETNAAYGNRVVFATAGATYHDCTWGSGLARANALYGNFSVRGSACAGNAALTLAAWQALDPAANDVGSTANATLPAPAEIVGWCREKLGM